MVLKNIKHYCLHRYNENEYTFIYKRTIQQTLHLNKDAYMDYDYNEEHIW